MNTLHRARIALLLLAAPIALWAGCERDTPSADQRVIVLGFDGLDAALTQRMLDEGRLPNFARLAAKGGFEPLGTSIPPHSPVAWSSIITGTNPGEHGIFDWVHRDPQTYLPYLCTTKTTGSGLTLPLGKWAIPLSSGDVVNLRYGEPFWDFLTRNGVDAHVYRIPANYPPKDPGGSGQFTTLTDMGTPDLAGTLGEFSVYSSGAARPVEKMEGGQRFRLVVKRNVAHHSFFGPPDALLDPNVKDASKPVPVPFTIYRDPEKLTAVVEWADNRVLLRQGEWSDWQTVEFPMGPSVAGAHAHTVAGLVRLFLKQVRPRLILYVSPVQIDPLNPALPISVPGDFSAKVARAIGRYYSQGLPEDTAALKFGVLSRDEFLEQADLIYKERLKLLDFALDNYDGGFLFFYFGSTDQIAHMFWAAMSASNPALTPAEREKYKNVMMDLYERVDKVVGRVMDRFPDATILCISDHGFGDFSRGFNVNTWLVQNGYAVLKDPDAPYPDNFDWSKTRAYGIGLNAVYINARGREEKGIVDPADKQQLIDEICEKMLQVRDPENGKRVIEKMYQSHKVYSGPRIDIGPDMVIGYDRGYRASWDTSLGVVANQLVVDNTDAWCADHCIAADLVPGVVFSSRKIKLDSPHLEDIAVTILDAYGIDPPPEMKGSSLFKTRRPSQTAAPKQANAG